MGPLEADKARALGLRKAGQKQKVVASRFGVTVKAMQRLEKAARALKQNGSAI